MNKKEYTQLLYLSEKPDRGQHLHPQARPRPKVFRAAVGPLLAGPAAPLPCPLHAHLCLLAQSGGTMVRDHHPAGDPPRQLFKRQGTERQDRAVRGGLQQDQGAVQLDGHGRFNSGEAQATLLANLRDRTQGGCRKNLSGAHLTANLAGLWRYRVGDYRVIARSRNKP